MLPAVKAYKNAKVLGKPVLGLPFQGSTETFTAVGNFDTEFEASACNKYICTKFVRALLSLKKVTQHNQSDTWEFVPMQDFTPGSDIDWNKSIAEIDRQLYDKYGLDAAQILFIETHIADWGD